MSEQQHRDVDERDDHAADDGREAVRVVPLESADDATVDAEREIQRHVHADDHEDPLARLRLIRREMEERAEVKGDAEGDQIRDTAGRGEDEEQRARDLVQRSDIPVRAILRDELDQRPAVAEIEDREVHRDRGREHPQAVGRGSEMRDVERQHHQSRHDLDEEREITRRDVARYLDELGCASVWKLIGRRAHSTLSRDKLLQLFRASGEARQVPGPQVTICCPK